MKTRMLTSVAAAALLFAAGAASAQGTMEKNQGTSRAPAAQQNAPAEKVAPSINEHKSTTGAASDEKNQMKGKSTTGAREKNEKSQMKGRSTTGAASEEKTEKSPKGKSTTGVNEKSNTRSGNRVEEQNRVDQQNKAGSANRNERSTVSQGSAAGMNKLSTEQRTKITTIFHEHRVAPARLNVSIRVGARIPESVRLYPVPIQVIEIYPEWRGFYYIYVGDEILVVSPRTHEIVAILEA